MERCKDYFGFAVWFAGVGYALLWPFSAIGNSGRPFGAFLVCGRAQDGVVAALCELPHPLALPIGLHMLGFAAAMLVGVRLSCRLLRRLSSRPRVIPAASVNARLPGALAARPSLPPPRRLHTVKPRKHFGLRGASR